MIQNLITTVLTGTRQFLAGNHRLAGLWYMVKYHQPECLIPAAAVVSQCHNSLQEVATLSIANNNFHFHGISLNRNRKVYSLSKSGQSNPILSVPPLTMKVTNIYLHNLNRTNRQITVYFKGYAYNEYPKW